MENGGRANGFLAFFVVFLIILSCSMGALIYFNKDVLLNNICKNYIPKTEDKCKKKCDVSYDINTEEFGLSATGAGLMVNVEKNRKDVTIGYDAYVLNSTFGFGWEGLDPAAGYKLLDTKTMKKRITQVMIDGSGQSAASLAILYLMEDGSVEYVPIKKDIEKNWNQTNPNNLFNSYGELDGVDDAISLISANADDYHTVLARNPDGTVNDLTYVFASTGDF